MAELVIDLLQLYRDTFGYIGRPRVPVRGDGRIANADISSDLEVGENLQSEGNSLLGTPFIMPMSIDGKRLPNEPLVDIAGAKTIIATPLDGVRGTFKEVYSIDDYRIRIRGFCVDNDNPNSYPETQVRMIKNLIEKNQSLTVDNKLAAYFGVTRLSIEAFNFPAVPGYETVQGYELFCLSDHEFDLELREN